MSSEQYVTTTDANAAVRGSEERVLDAIGINWRDGRPHITCPYPDHGGDNDWRWDERRTRAICTCTPKGDSVFDVLMKCEGVDFDRAKIRVVEIVGRSEVIRTRGAGKADGEHRQRTDARSLLNVDPKLRDDDLVATYLATRLGIDEADVMLPSTPFRGISQMPYYEVSGRGTSKTVKTLGLYPCAVFGQVDASGRNHAHRIYLAPGGRGKADLGKTSKGFSRDAKKSSKKIDEKENVNGRAVLWGDPTKAPHLVVTEGIETAAAVAHALRAEIEADEVAVASAIAATGVEALQPTVRCRLSLNAKKRRGGSKIRGASL